MMSILILIFALGLLAVVASWVTAYSLILRGTVDDRVDPAAEDTRTAVGSSV